MTSAPQDQDKLDAERDKPTELLYTLKDRPPWSITIILAFQHCITMICSTVPIPFLVSSLLCLGPSHPMRGYFVSTIIFVSGVNTLLQSTLGVRLPIVSRRKLRIPVLLALLTSWLLCWLLTYFEVLQEGSAARTDNGIHLVSQSPWFYVPYPGQWGVPRVMLSAVLGCMAAGFASMVESIGDYIICAKVSGGSPPPMHAINRGVMIEGVGVALAGLFGTGSGTNSYSENIATLVITRVGSRRVVQVSAVFMMILGIFSKFGALCGSLPAPIIASLYFVLFSYIVSASLPMLNMIKIHSPRNLFILGFSVFFSLSISKFVKTHPEIIDTGLPFFDQTLVTLLQTTMFLGSIISCFLDNTVPGSGSLGTLAIDDSLIPTRTQFLWASRLLGLKTLEDHDRFDTIVADRLT
ncbi:hypothetical protein O3P69_004011 [Scylla paramamosain]|uniref:Uncharacterized protein n=1 Tax=Scylla paramamosain TaxID=85552 RepID=A0AAW0UH69_SCYPA